LSESWVNKIMIITPPDENTLVASKKRVGPFGGTPQAIDRLKQPFKITLSDDKENTPVSSRPNASQSSQRLYGGTRESLDRLIKPFKCPGSATVTRTSDKPTRKRRKIDYVGTDGEKEDGDKAWTNEDRLALANRDANKFPVFQVKDKETMFRKRFAVPLINKDAASYNPNRPPPTLGLRKGAVFVAKPLHDPSGEFAIVLYDPTVDEKPRTIEEAKKGDESAAPKIDAPLVHKSLAEILGIKKVVESERPKVPVVIDPKLAKVLRPHQIEGVKFMYKAVTGMIEEKANGCIMADEMGLGKTLQCITLMWTLLKQSPDAGKPTIQKAIIACPSSLVRNWANELVKWLGPDAIQPFAIDGKATKEELTQQLRQWAIASGRAVTRPVIIVSYETLRLNVDELKNIKIGLMLCDEGHRLKNGDSQTFTALNNLNVSRRVILSGTPIQNDLTEYFSLISFANPGLLGTRMEFRKKYELPILRGRDAAGSDKDRERGDQCLRDLLDVVNRFIIRRTNDILSKYLPVKYEHVVFCNLAPFQLDLYNYFITSPDIKALLRGKGSQPLKAIGMLKKLCNHPDLLNLAEDLPGCEEHWPEDYVPKDARGRDRHVKPHFSGKMQVLDRMLARIRQDTNDKIVLISNYTQTLDIFDKLCQHRGYGRLRLDGTMNVTKRQKLVDKFNDPNGDEFVFLLSSKAGGCGLNLIGANRLVLFDPDWNPAADQQALARVWRDGQKKDCFVYRFIATGTIEEKIFQRQSHKQSLSSCVVDSAQDVERHFTLDSLRELFQYHGKTTSDTHDTFKCQRCKPDGKQHIKAPAMMYGDTSSWNHFVNEGLKPIQDLLLRQECGEKEVSAVFQYISH
jgi:DNA repair and recombination RAD54-like protein